MNAPTEDQLRAERLTHLQSMGLTPAEAKLVDEHARGEAAKAMNYGANVVRALLPERLHPVAVACYIGTLHGLAQGYRDNIAAQAMAKRMERTVQ